jgi:hypothetical protein
MIKKMFAVGCQQTAYRRPQTDSSPKVKSLPRPDNYRDRSVNNIHILLKTAHYPEKSLSSPQF